MVYTDWGRVVHRKGLNLYLYINYAYQWLHLPVSLSEYDHCEHHHHLELVVMVCLVDHPIHVALLVQQMWKYCLQTKHSNQVYMKIQDLTNQKQYFFSTIQMMLVTKQKGEMWCVVCYGGSFFFWKQYFFLIIIINEEKKDRKQIWMVSKTVFFCWLQVGEQWIVIIKCN